MDNKPNGRIRITRLAQTKNSYPRQYLHHELLVCPYSDAIPKYAFTDDPRYSLLESRKNLNADVLLTYLVHPETALHLGYNNNFQNYDPSLTWTREGLLRSQREYLRDSWQVFVKVLYLVGL